jgi:hypothetical protein
MRNLVESTPRHDLGSRSFMPAKSVGSDGSGVAVVVGTVGASGFDTTRTSRRPARPGALV